MSIPVLLILLGLIAGLLYLARRQALGTAVLLVSAIVITMLLIYFGSRALADGDAPIRVRGFFFLGLVAVLGGLFYLGLRRNARERQRALHARTCPPIAHLNDWLSNRLAPEEHARLAAHLEVCPACLHRLEGLTAGQKSWPEMARKLAPRPAPDPALKKVVDELKSAKDPEATRDQPLFHADLPLGFLSPPEKPDHLGKLGPYEVLSEIGRGGMGIVLKAFDPTLHRVVAIKVLAPQLATSGVARKRFMREAQAVAAVTHDHIVTIHAVDEANGLPYLVMQCVAGMSLQDRIDKEGPLPLKEIVRIGMQTASGLAAAHAQGIVHRDIKPGNILLENGVQRVKITDFGLARAMDDASLTGSGYVAGSPQFMAPEQARGETLDHRADLFSLGSVLYTMCTGRPPFRAANTLAILRRVCDDTPRPVREINPEIPEWLAAVVDKLHAKDPAARYQSANEVADELGQHLAQLQGAAWMPPPKHAAPPEPGLLTSLTVCPSCGAHLHVPEKMVGSVVHCSECGKPFQVEDGSEIQVARAVRPPMRVRRHSRSRMPGWLVVFCVGLLLLATMAFMWLGASHPSIEPAHAEISATPSSAGPFSPAQYMNETSAKTISPMAQPKSFWKDTLSWLPEEATLFGAVDLQAFGSLSLDDDFTKDVLRVTVPPEVRKQITSENLGRVRIDSVSAAYYADAKSPEKARQYIHIVGLALDGRKRVAEGLVKTISGGKVDEGKQIGGTKKLLRVSGPSAPVAVGFYDDNHIFIPGGADEVKGPPALKVLDQLAGFGNSFGPNNVVTGEKPPWETIALSQVPADACFLLVGEIPEVARRFLRDELQWPVAPRSFITYAGRTGPAVAVSLTLNLENSGHVSSLWQSLRSKKTAGIRQKLQAWFPKARFEVADIHLIDQAIGGAQIDVRDGAVHIYLQFSQAQRQAVATMFKAIANARE